MEETKPTMKDFITEIMNMAKNCHSIIGYWETRVDKIDLPEEEKDKYKELAKELASVLEKLDEFTEKYDIPVKEPTPTEKVVNEVDGLTKINDTIMYLLNAYMRDAEVKEAKVEKCNELMQRLKLLMKDFEEWRNEYAQQTSEYERVKGKITYLFNHYKEDFVDFYNTYISEKGQDKDKIYFNQDEKTREYIKKYFSKYSPVEIAFAFMDGQYDSKDLWCVVGNPMKSHDDPMDFLENKEEFIKTVVQEYMDNTLPDELMKMISAPIYFDIADDDYREDYMNLPVYEGNVDDDEFEDCEDYNEIGEEK